MPGMVALVCFPQTAPLREEKRLNIVLMPEQDRVTTMSMIPAGFEGQVPGIAMAARKHAEVSPGLTWSDDASETNTCSSCAGLHAGLWLRL
jgi:hypothetical protein